MYLVTPCSSYRSEVRLAAVISCRDVSDVDDPEATARLRVQTFTVEVPDPSENLLDGGGVITDDVGGFRNVVTVPATTEKKHLLKT